MVIFWWDKIEMKHLKFGFTFYQKVYEIIIFTAIFWKWELKAKTEDYLNLFVKSFLKGTDYPLVLSPLDLYLIFGFLTRLITSFPLKNSGAFLNRNWNLVFVFDSIYFSGDELFFNKFVLGKVVFREFRPFLEKHQD